MTSSVPSLHPSAADPALVLGAASTVGCLRRIPCRVIRFPFVTRA
jgi:hypothetical protein